MDIDPQNLSTSNPVEESWESSDDSRFYPEADPELGIERSNLSETAYRYKFTRYNYIADVIMSNTKDLSGICDVGSGSGYGTNFLKLSLGDKVYGLDINERALSYARKWYPDVRFFSEVQPDTDCMIFAGSRKIISKAEFRDYIKDVPVVVIAEAMTGLKAQCYEDIGTLNNTMIRYKFLPIYFMLDQDTFIHGENSIYYIGLFAREEVI